MHKTNIIADRIAGIQKLPYGFLILIMCSLSVFFSSPGQTYFTSVFIEHYIADFGWSRSLVSSLYSAATLISGSLLMFVGRLADKYGSRRMTMVAAVVLGLATLFNSLIVAPWMLFATFFLGRISGQGSLTLLPATILPKWFVRKRALAFSLMSLGSVIGSATLPPINSLLIAQFGWRTTWRLWTFLVLIVFLPLVWLFLFDEPDNLGAKTDFAQREQVKSTSATRTIPEYVDVPGWTLKQAMRTFAFWSSIYVQALIPMIITGLTFHFLSIMVSRGVSQAEAPFILSVIALTGLPVTLLAGAILGKMCVLSRGFPPCDQVNSLM